MSRHYKEQPSQEPLATTKVFSDSQGKKFYFDLMRNHRGVYLRISERKGQDRSTVIIPEDAIRDAWDAMTDMVDALP